MARAKTAKFEELVLEVEFGPTGVFSTICGINDVTISYTSNIDTSEVPDCDDESLPMALERQVRSQEVTASGTGVWAVGSGPKLKEWWRSGDALKVRLRNVRAAADGEVGSEIAEEGFAILASIQNGRTKGQKVTAEIELQFDGVPVPTLKVA